MNRIFIVFLFILLSASSFDAQGQRRKKSADNQANTVTPENAAKQEHKDRAQKESQYVMKKDHHSASQDKATRKRMKKNLKRAQKHSWGKDVPWYKRWFRKKSFH
jgi:hypothetical protein